MSNPIFDFGFTAVDESELEAVQALGATAKEVETKAADTQSKIDELYNAIVPLLNNLKKNPEKEYILWPDRLSKVEAFENYLLEIYQR